MVVWKILTALNLGLVLGLYSLILVAVIQVRNKKKKLATKVTVKQTSPKTD